MTDPSTRPAPADVHPQQVARLVRLARAEAPDVDAETAERIALLGFREGVRSQQTLIGNLRRRVEDARAEVQRATKALASQRAMPNLERPVKGALLTAIDAHGPITRNLVGSAVKRVIANLIEVGVVTRGEVDHARHAPTTTPEHTPEVSDSEEENPS